MRKLIPSLALTIAFGVAGFAGILSGCSESQQNGNLLTNPDQAYSDKSASTLSGVDPVPAEPEAYSGVCEDAAAEPGAPCARVRFHQTSPPLFASTIVYGTHLTTFPNISKYDIGGGVIIEHNTTWLRYSEYSRSWFTGAEKEKEKMD